METSLSERIVLFLWHSLNTDFQRVCKILVRACAVHGDIYVWIMHFMWPSSIVWRAKLCRYLPGISGWLASESSSQRDTAVISERHTTANWASEHPATLPCSPFFSFLLALFLPRCFFLSLLYLPLCLFIPHFCLISLIFLLLASLSLSLSLSLYVILCWELSSYRLQFSYVFWLYGTIQSFSKKKKINQHETEVQAYPPPRSAISETHKAYKYKCI